jgi:16S rRNA (guanine966-N2)-methyltransferase
LPQGFLGQRVLDAFAGSGALGLEALSRGASSVIFCENNKSALQTLRSNVSSLDLEANQTKILSCDTFAPRVIALLKDLGPFDLIFLDPPYATDPERVDRLLNAFCEANILADGCLISYEHSREESKAEKGTTKKDSFTKLKNVLNERFQLVSNKIYGFTEIDYYLYHRNAHH